MAKTEKKRAKPSASAFNAFMCTLLLVALAFVVMALSALLAPSLPFGPRDRMDHGLPQELENYFSLRIGLSLLNLALVIYLLYIYVGEYLKLRASFTLGIVAFLFSFLLYAMSTVPSIHVLFGGFGFASGFSFIPLLFSAIGLIAFAKLGTE